jgi:hypothetical protein
MPYLCAGRDRNDVIHSALNETYVASGGSFEVASVVQPTTTESVYVGWRESIVVAMSSYVISGLSGWTLEGVWINGDYVGTSSSLAISKPAGNLVMVLSAIDDGSQTNLSDEITVTIEVPS